MDQKEIYNARDLPQEKGFFPWEEGHRFLHRAPSESNHMGIHILGRGVLSLGS